MRFVLPALLALATAAALAGGVYLLFRDPAAGSRIEIILPTATPPRPTEVKVYVSGAVLRPGVYTVAEGTRLQDAIEAAGGAAPDADLDRVNLAIRVRDQDHWHIPARGTPGPADAGAVSGTVGRLDLNAATTEQLVALPGIGSVRADAIVRYREANGPFASVDDLLAVAGIGPTTLAGIRDLVEVR